ncbi:MAG: hypothetical protein NVSMB17_07990 [Candidatus Dormibacteria bacterium]
MLGLLALLGGVALVAAGLILLSRSISQLNRVGAFSSLYWASFRRYASYRVRSLRPAAVAVAGIALIGVGLTLLYLGLISFYTGRLFSPT